MILRALLLATAASALAPPRSSIVRRSTLTAAVEGTVESAIETVWLDPAAERERSNLGEAVAASEVVLVVPGVADGDEVDALVAAGIAATDGSKARSRLSVSDAGAFSLDTVALVDAVLLRALDALDASAPSIYATLFDGTDGRAWSARQPPRSPGGGSPGAVPDARAAAGCGTLRGLYAAGELEWSEGEPAINVYEAGGAFSAHKDHLALSVLVPLSDAGRDFAGAGTGYWPPEASDLPDGADPGDPPFALAPPRGSALVFGGNAVHSGLPVASGIRCVLVASFSTRTPDSPPDRVSGLRPCATSSSLRDAS